MARSKAAKERKQEESYNAKPYETIVGKRNSKKYARIYLPMIESAAFKSLTPKQKELYLYMKLEDYSADRPLKESGEPYSHEYFYFNELKWKRVHGLYTQRQGFTRDRDVLIDRGFIQVAEHYRYGGRNQKNVYRFHDGWKEWQDTS